MASSASALQVFFWTGQGQRKESENRTYYNSFSLNGHSYTTGECVFLFPEDEKYPHYIGRIEKAFVDESSTAADPHCIEVRWYERRINLETSTKGIEESEREVFELEEKDVNPIGCISGKCFVTKSPSYEEACKRMAGTKGDWFFCRGYFLQHTNSFKAYDEHDLADNHHPPAQPAAAVVPSNANARPMAHVGAAGGVPESSKAAGGGVRRGPAPQHRGAAAGATAGPSPAAAAPRAPGSTGKGRSPASAASAAKNQDRVCVECGATSTPQWREGPKGPKTLCNACGVRYVRAQQKARGKLGGGPQQKNGPSSLGNPPVPQTQHSRATTSPGAPPTEQDLAAQDGNALPRATRRALRTMTTSTTIEHAASKGLPARCGVGVTVCARQPAHARRLDRHARRRPRFAAERTPRCVQRRSP